MKIFSRQSNVFLCCCLCKQFCFRLHLSADNLFCTRVSNQWSRLVMNDDDDEEDDDDGDDGHNNTNNNNSNNNNNNNNNNKFFVVFVFLFFLLQGSQVTVFALFSKFSF